MTGMISAAAAAFMAGTLGAMAEPVSFAGERIDLVVPFGPGGGTSLYARLVGSLLEEELPGHPAIVIRNLEGGGSVRGLNHFHAHARPDGLTLAALSSASYFSHLLGDPTVRYDLAAFIPILASPAGFIAYGRVDHGLTGDPVGDVRLLQERPSWVAVDDPTSSDMMVLYCYDLLGIDIHPVWGVPSGEARQALMRGETQLNHESVSAFESDVLPMIEAGEVVPLFTMGMNDPSGELVRDPLLPAVPSCPELYQLVTGLPLPATERAVYELMLDVRMSVAKAIALPPGTPWDIVRTYQDAMARVVERDELKTSSARLILGGYDQIVGKAALQAHRQATIVDEDVVKALIDWLNRRWGLRL